MTAIPFALGCVAVEHFWHASNLLVFFVQIAVLLPLVPMSLMLIFREEVGVQIREWRRRRAMPDANALNHEYEPSTISVP